MNLARSFSHAFKDSSWFFKVFVGGLFLILSIAAVGIPFVLGYEARHAASVSRQEDAVLPEWKRLSGFFRDGMKILAAMLTYLAVLVGIAVGIAGVRSSVMLVTIIALAAIAMNPLLLILYNRSRTFLGCFRLLTMIGPIVRHPAAFILGLTVSFVVGLGALALGWMSLILGWPFVIFWAIVVKAHIAGQLATFS